MGRLIDADIMKDDIKELHDGIVQLRNAMAKEVRK